MATPQLVQEPPEKELNPTPALVNVVTVGVAVPPGIRYTLAVFAVHTVVFVSGFEAQEFTALAVGIGFVAGRTGAPSTLTTATPVVEELQEPFGTYETTFVPVTNTDNELDGAQEPGGGATLGGTLKLSVLESLLAKMRTLGSDPEIVASPTATAHALYSPPLFGVTENGAS
jgi:hypothetical protein